MPNPPKVSVILTSYNHAKYLREAIDSTLNQTFADFELIIWDDASTDGSWEIIQSYADARIKTFRNEKQSLARYGMNKAIQEVARGDYIAIHHSDDAWLPEKLEKQVAFLEASPNIGAVFSDVLVMGENGELLPENSHSYQKLFAQPNRSRHEWLNHFFYKGNALAHPSVLIRKQCYSDCGVYRFGFPAADYDMWVRLCMQHEIHILPEKLIKFRVRDGGANITGDRLENRLRTLFQYHQILRNYLNILSFEELLKIFPNAASYVKPNGFIPDYVLAMMALETPRVHNILRLFGLELLFELINDPENKRRVEEVYGFSITDYLEVVGKHDVFSVELTTQLRAAIAQKDTLLAEKDTLLAERYAIIQEIFNSKGWKIITAFRKIKSKFRISK
jgi:glycosyltransferase involved in cell wall biosynthesis